MSENTDFNEEQGQESPQNAIVEEQNTEEIANKVAEINSDLEQEDTSDENATEDNTEEQDPDKEFAKKGYKRAEFNEEQQDRVNYMFKQIKATDAKIVKQDKLLEDMRDNYAGALDRLQKFEDAEVAKAKQTRINQIKRDMAEANATADYDKVAELTYDMQEVVKEPVQAVEQPVQKQEQAQTPVAPETQTFVDNWITEKDDKGQLVRPWVQDGHELQSYVKGLIQTVVAHPDFENATAQEVFNQVDLIMSPNEEKDINKTVNKEQPSHAAVSNTNSSYRPANTKNSVSSLTNNERYVAEQMMPELSKEEAYKAYAANK